MAGEAYLDLLATTLTEHEKNLDVLIKRLEKIVAVLKTADTEPEGPKCWEQSLQRRIGEPDPEEDFKEAVGETLMKLPKGYNFEIAKIRHTAYVGIVYDEPRKRQEETSDE